jgi:EAL domain-containing protein (putative c-di-GMP-specific phosphodiesterase class I)/FixJ family two-component response regulator
VGAVTVVVVDDELPNVRLLETMLRAMGIPEVHGYTDPRAALRDCLEQPPDLIVLDLHMPELDGLGFMAALDRHLPVDSFLPVLVLTADRTPEAKQQALSSAAKDFLTKPFDRAEVELRVRNLLETRALYARVQSHNTELRTRLEEQAALERRAAFEQRERLQRVTRVLESDGLDMLFQPVIDLDDGRVVGVEALARIRSEPPRPPHLWFAEASEVGLGSRLELAAIARALRALESLPDDAYLAVNLSPETVFEPGLDEVLASAEGHRVVIELTEHSRVAEYEPLLESLSRFRRRGTRIAVDDAGAGYAGLQHILRLRPEIIKLDIDLIHEIDRDPARRALASSLIAFSHEIDAVIVAEGIETTEELVTLRELGVPSGQGYHIARPGSLPVAGHLEIPGIRSNLPV